MCLIGVVIAWILLVLFAGCGLASIAFLTEGEVKIIAAEADPVTLPGHGCEYKAIKSVLGRRGVGSHFEF